MCERARAPPAVPRRPHPSAPVHAGRARAEWARIGRRLRPSAARIPPRAGDAVRRVLVRQRDEPGLIKVTAELSRHREAIGRAEGWSPRSHRGSSRLQEKVRSLHTHAQTHTHATDTRALLEPCHGECGGRGAHAGRSLFTPQCDASATETETTTKETAVHRGQDFEL